MTLSLRHRCVLIFALLGALVASPLLAQSGGRAQVQRQIETEIKTFLAEQLAAGEFYVFALVQETQASDTSAVLPFTSVNVPPSVLQKILNDNLGAAAADGFQVQVTVGFDERLPPAKRTLLENVIRQRFGFDGEQKVLTVETIALVSPRIADSERFDLERARFEAEQARLTQEKAVMEAEQARLRLESEQVKLEAKRREFELTEKLAAAEKAQQDTSGADLGPNGQPVINVNSGGGAEAAGEVLKVPPLVKDIQFIAIGFLMFGGIIIFAVMMGRSIKPFSNALESVGQSIESAAKSMAPSQTSVTMETDKGGEGAAAGATGEPMAIAGVMSEAQAAANEEFIKQIEDKVAVLSTEKNFNFYRIFSDMIHSSSTLPLAASILVSVDSGTAKTIIKDLAVDDIAAIKNFLSTEGGLMHAKDKRADAMTNFYGRIALEEFTDSPLMELKDLTWLTKMSTPDMIRFIVGLTDDQRPVFLACLSAERIARLLEGTTTPEEKETMLRSVAMIDTVTEDQIQPLISELAGKAPTEDPATQTRRAVDGARYIAKVAETLNEEEQQILFGLIGDKQDLMDRIREHYIPFNTVLRLPKDLIVEIFGERPDKQLAVILFDTDEDVREKVVRALPEIRAESVKDEIRALDGDSFYEKRNRKNSGLLQREVSKYLLKLYAEGLLTLEDADQGGGQGATTAA